MPKIKYPQLAGLQKTDRKAYAKAYNRLTKENIQEWRVKECYNNLPSDAREIPDYPTYYATPNGEIWRDTTLDPNAIKSGKNRIVKIKDRHNPSCNYYQVQLYKDGKRKLCYVHRLVLLAIEGYPEKSDMECHHIDADTSNNCITNLEWVTREQNIRYVPREKRMVSKKKYGSGRQFSETKWSEYRKLITNLADTGLGPKAISEELNIPLQVAQYHKRMYKKYS